MIRLLTIRLLTLALFAPVVPVMAAPPQSVIEEEVDAAKRLYQDGRLQEAIDALRAVIVRLNTLRDAQERTRPLAEAHLHLGLAHLAMRNESAAVENFRQVAALDPDRVLDPEIYAPRVLSVFERARADVVRKRAAETLVQPTDARARPEATGVIPLVPGGEPLLRILPGTKVRVERTGPRLAVEGQLLGINENVMTIGAADWRVDLPRETLTRVQIVTARKNHWIAGMLIGATFGATVGAFETPGCGGNDGDCYTRGENIGYGTLGFGIVGALVGALYRTDQWADVPLNQGAVPARSARNLGFSFSW